MYKSEEHELFSDVTDDFVGNNFQDVETDCLAQRSAFTDHNDITFLNCESWWTVNWDISVSLFVSVVLGNVVEVISSDDYGSLHLGGNADTLQDSASDGNVAGEGAFLIDVGWFNGLFGSSESESDVFEVSDSRGGFFSEQLFSVKEDCVLFLEGSFVLSYFKRSTWLSAIGGCWLNLIEYL